MTQQSQYFSTVKGRIFCMWHQSEVQVQALWTRTACFLWCRFWIPCPGFWKVTCPDDISKRTKSFIFQTWPQLMCSSRVLGTPGFPLLTFIALENLEFRIVQLDGTYKEGCVPHFCLGWDSEEYIHLSVSFSSQIWGGSRKC